MRPHVSNSVRKSVIALRAKGKTYREICTRLHLSIPQSTLSYWCKDITLNLQAKRRLQDRLETHLRDQRIIALQANLIRRNKYLYDVEQRVVHIGSNLKNKKIAKIILAALYWCEGKKSQTSSLMFGNSNPDIIRMFLSLLRASYNIDEKKFRCTLQGRADQRIRELERYWSKTTKIPVSQFYKARVDPRSTGKISRKQNYKGVCRIDYFSADIFHELEAIQKSLVTYMGL